MDGASGAYAERPAYLSGFLLTIGLTPGSKVRPTRYGLGKVGHIEVRQLWAHDKVASGEIQVGNVDGKINIADLLREHVGSEGIRVHMLQSCQSYVEGRHNIMPHVPVDGYFFALCIIAWVAVVSCE